MRILLVEDDENLAQMLEQALVEQHYLVDLAIDGQAGWELAEAFEYDLILLDVMLPKLDGISFCQQLRVQGDRTPILLLTAQDHHTNKVAGLDAGADDYIIKPFNLQELLARIRAVLRRGSSILSPVLEWGALQLNPSNCQVTYDGQLLHLTSKEYALLELFLRNTSRIFSQSALLDHLWSFDEPPTENAVRAHIKSLRQKLKQAGATDPLETVYGLGYRLRLTAREAKIPEGAKVQSEVKSHSGDQIPAELIPLWERAQPKYSDRVKVLEAIAAQGKGTPNEALRQQAFREAHTLAGSLGSFGLVEASRLSRQIEQLLQPNRELAGDSVERLSGLVAALRQAIGQPVISPPPALPSTPVMRQSQLLIVDRDAELTQAIISEANAMGIQAAAVTTLSQAREAIARTRPDVVLLDLNFSNSLEEGFGLLAELAIAQPPVPVLVLTAEQSFANRVKVARLGGQGFLPKPVSPTEVAGAIAQIRQKSSLLEGKLMIVDDDPQLLDFLSTLLAPWGFRLTLLNNPDQFWNTLEQFIPDLLILDVEMPLISGIDLCQVVRNAPRWSALPVLFLSARTDANTIQQVFAAGADDYVNKPVVGPELIARILNRLERTSYQRKLQQLSGTFDVTN